MSPEQKGAFISAAEPVHKPFTAEVVADDDKANIKVIGASQ
jgi:hypothetical protein